PFSNGIANQKSKLSHSPFQTKTLKPKLRGLFTSHKARSRVDCSHGERNQLFFFDWRGFSDARAAARSLFTIGFGNSRSINFSVGRSVNFGFCFFMGAILMDMNLITL